MDLDDRAQATEEEIARDIIATQRQLDGLLTKLPARIEAQSNAKRDLDVIKAQIKHCRDRISGRQSLLRSLRP